jgi:hypothetical protein
MAETFGEAGHVQKLLPDPPRIGRQDPRELLRVSLAGGIHDESSPLLEGQTHEGPGAAPLDLRAQESRPPYHSVELARLGGHARDVPHEDAIVADTDDDGAPGVGQAGPGRVDDPARHLNQELLVPPQAPRL